MQVLLGSFYLKRWYVNPANYGHHATSPPIRRSPDYRTLYSGSGGNVVKIGLYYIITLYTIHYYTITLYTITLLHYYTILYYAILYYTILYYTTPYYTILYYTILYYCILHYYIRCYCYQSWNLWIQQEILETR